MGPMEHVAEDEIYAIVGPPTPPDSPQRPLPRDAHFFEDFASELDPVTVGGELAIASALEYAPPTVSAAPPTSHANDPLSKLCTSKNHVARSADVDAAGHVDDLAIAGGTAPVLDSHFWEVLSIVAHRGTPRKRSKMVFKVRRQDFGPEDDTWVPYANVKTSRALLDYCKANNLKM